MPHRQSNLSLNTFLIPLFIIGALSFGLAPTVWLYASQTEVFALNNLLVSLLLILCVWLFRDPTSPKRVYTCAFFAGFAATNQLTSFLFVVPFVLHLYTSTNGDLLNVRSLLAQAVAFALGLSPYLRLVTLSSRMNARSWGDQTTLQGWLRHILRREYGTFQLQVKGNTSSEGNLYRLVVYLQHLMKESSYVGAVLFLIGVYSLLNAYRHSQDKAQTSIGKPKKSRHQSALLAFVSAYGFYVLVFVALNRMSLTPLNRGVQERFWPQPYMIVCILASVGLKIMANKIRLAKALAALFVLAYLMNGMETRDWSQATTIDAYGRAVLQDMPTNSIMLLQGDAIYNVVTYLQHCEGLRRDVSILHLSLMKANWFMERQSQHFPLVRFPTGARRYRPSSDGIQPACRECGEYNLADFFEANRYYSPMFVCFMGARHNLPQEEYGPAITVR